MTHETILLFTTGILFLTVITLWYLNRNVIHEKEGNEKLLMKLTSHISLEDIQREKARRKMR